MGFAPRARPSNTAGEDDMRYAQASGQRVVTGVLNRTSSYCSCVIADDAAERERLSGTSALRAASATEEASE